MYKSKNFISEAFIQQYSIPVGIVGLALTAMSTFGVKMTGQFEAYTFWASIWLLLAVIILTLIALSLAVKQLNKYCNSLFNIGELPPLLSICSISNGSNAKIILHPKENINLQKDSVVSVILADDEEGDIELGLGVITHQQADGRIALVATPKRNMESRWSTILKNSSEYTSKIRVRTVIDRNYINDDYLYKESYEISSLSSSASDLKSDGTGTKL